MVAFSRGMLRLAILAALLAACQKTSPPVERQSCLDLQLAAKGLNSFGDPPDTNYPGGTPLFDEKTGKSRDRTDYVYSRHPEIAASCGGDR